MARPRSEADKHELRLTVRLGCSLSVLQGTTDIPITLSLLNVERCLAMTNSSEFSQFPRIVL